MEFECHHLVAAGMTAEFRETIRIIAGKILRSDELIGDEKTAAAAILRENSECGNPHAVRCEWCKQTGMLFRDEDAGVFKRKGRGWQCATCDEPASYQEVKF